MLKKRDLGSTHREKENSLEKKGEKKEKLLRNPGLLHSELKEEKRGVQIPLLICNIYGGGQGLAHGCRDEYLIESPECKPKQVPPEIFATKNAAPRACFAARYLF